MSGNWPEYRQNIIVMCRNPALTTAHMCNFNSFKSGYLHIQWSFFMKAFSTVKLRLSNYISILFNSYICTWIASYIDFRRDLLKCTYACSERVYVTYEHRGRKETSCEHIIMESFSSHSNALCCLDSLIINIVRRYVVEIEEYLLPFLIISMSYEPDDGF